MKRTFTETPAAWTRASRQFVTPADYASPVEVFASKGHSAAPWIGGAIFAGLCAALIVGWMK